jgi:hypothetical protein
MAVSVKKAILWRREVDNQPGMLANTLQPLSEAGADLQVVMAYRYPGGENKAAIELHPGLPRTDLLPARYWYLPALVREPELAGNLRSGGRRLYGILGRSGTRSDLHMPDRRLARGDSQRGSLPATIGSRELRSD